ncbi:MAG: hypothetical protein ABIG63_02485, partial [Chloroflexota bacterium]
MSFMLAGDELGDALARNVGAFDDRVLPVRWNEKSQRWHAAADFEFNGKAYKTGQFVSTELGQYAPRRPGLEPRADLGWQKGQLTDMEYNALRDLAQTKGKPIVMSGSLTETDIGLLNRYNPNFEFPPNSQWRS